jgi:hypothetical protein
MSIKSVLGLDAFDVALHAIVTGILLFWIAAVNREDEAIIIGSMTTIASLIVLGVRRRLALSRAERRTLGSDEMAAERLAELELRVGDLEAAHSRIAELEERLDFTERLIATSSERSKELTK